MTPTTRDEERASISSSKVEPNKEGTSRSPSASTISSLPPPATAFSQRQHNVDDWDGPNDPGNPLNWSLPKKMYHTAVPSAIAFVTTLASSIYTPGMDSVQREFGVSAEVSLLPFSLYVLGLACGPMIAAPCSETLGRKKVYLAGLPIFALFILGSGFSNNMAALAICRFFAGVFGSPGLAIGSATISEIWAPADRAVPMALYVTTPFLGPAIGPLVGGYASLAFDWRWTEWTLLFFTVACCTPVLLMQETYKKEVLRQRAKKLGTPSAGPQRKPLQAAKFFLRSTLTRPIHMAFVEPVVGLFTLYVALNFGMVYCFFAAFPYVFQTVYGFGLGAIGLTFLSLGIGGIAAGGIIIAFAKIGYKRQVVQSHEKGNGGKVPPEARLYIAMVGSVLLPTGLFWFGWTAENHVHWIAPVIAEGVFACGNQLIFMASTLYVMDFYGPLYGASAMGANNLIRYIFGAAFPLFAVQLFSGLGIGWACSLLGFLSLAMTPIPWLFYIFGPRLRQMSRYTSGTDD